MKSWLSVLLAVVAVSCLRAEEPVIDAADLDALRARSGSAAVVVGQVTTIGTTKDGEITFVNIGMPKKQGFVAIVFREHYGAFPDGFGKFRDQKVRVSGVIKLYRGETPQIELRSPEQITVVTE
jgi:hypothetical protein